MELVPKIDLFSKIVEKNAQEGSGDKLTDIFLKQILPILEDIRESLKVKANRELLTSEHWKLLERLLHTSVADENSLLSTPLNLALVTELCRLFRNACAESLQNQNFIIRSENLIKDAVELLRFLMDRHEEMSGEEVTLSLRCCLQFMGNLIVHNDESKKILWNFLYLEHDVFNRLLKSKDIKVKEYSTMILYNCLIPLHTSYLASTDKGKTLINTLVAFVVRESSDWSLLCLEKLVQEKSFVVEVFDSLPLESKFVILDLIAEHLSKCMDQQHFALPPCSISHISNRFKKSALNIVMLCTPEHINLESVEIDKLLSVLCIASSNEHYSCIFEGEYDLIESAVDVLKSVHFIGKTEGNPFSPIQTLKAESEVDASEIEHSPAFGFKRNLVRLIGNLSALSKENQDAVRRMDGIPLLLDCCNIDSRNPYIIQWCILAIRNLLQKNPENQAAVASISVTGDLANSSLLKELGFSVESCNGRFVLRSGMPV